MPKNVTKFMLTAMWSFVFRVVYSILVINNENGIPYQVPKASGVYLSYMFHVKYFVI